MKAAAKRREGDERSLSDSSRLSYPLGAFGLVECGEIETAGSIWREI